MRAQTHTAERLAQFLQRHRGVERVFYPGLESHPGHEIARKQMSGFGAMLSFCVRGGRDEAFAVAARTKLFTRATSLGGVESLIEHRASVEGPHSVTPENLLRVSVGLENVGGFDRGSGRGIVGLKPDLQAPVGQALARLFYFLSPSATATPAR